MTEESIAAMLCCHKVDDIVAVKIYGVYRYFRLDDTRTPTKVKIIWTNKAHPEYTNFLIKEML